MPTEVTAVITIVLDDKELDEAEGDEFEALVNTIWHTGAQVVCIGDECDC